MMHITPVSNSNKTQALALLQKANLPTKDIDSKVALFALKENNQTIGTIGLESEGTVALLRSLSVDGTKRGKGYGTQLVDFIEATAKQQDVQILYLLTTTAADFFANRGYEIIQRSEAPQFIQQTSEFSSVCPSSAIVMKKELA